MSKSPTLNTLHYTLYIFLLLLLTGCQRPTPTATITSAAMAPFPDVPSTTTPLPTGVPIPPTFTTTPLPSYDGTPTPNPTRPGTQPNQITLIHTVTSGETLLYIAQLYNSSITELVALNNLQDEATLNIGQQLFVPSGADLFSPSFKIIPDSELVYGPGAQDFNLPKFLNTYNSYLLTYTENVEGFSLTGMEIVQLVADRFSVNPRLLLSALEYRIGWVTQSNPIRSEYPMGQATPGREGLYNQLSWTANQINLGYYGRAEGGLTSFLIGTTTTRLGYAPDINDGTAGIQNWLASHDTANYNTWLLEVSPDGFFATYSRLFGNPFAYTVDPLWPPNLTQPRWDLPWPQGDTWYFTGGPHGGWAPGSAWAALDFAPGTDQLGCYESEAWVSAVAAGTVVRSSLGAVVIDHDNDGYAGTGWATIYFHLATHERIPPGTFVQTGQKLGHPSCEGGFSNGTHLHLARTYNGRWVSADGNIPFVLDGWTSVGLLREYDGLLVRGDETREACQCREDLNAITND